MPNTLTTIFRSSPASLAVEAPHPNTGVYLTGTQLADGTWQIIHTGVTKTASPLTITGRLVGTRAAGAPIHRRTHDERHQHEEGNAPDHAETASQK